MNKEEEKKPQAGKEFLEKQLERLMIKWKNSVEWMTEAGIDVDKAQREIKVVKNLLKDLEKVEQTAIAKDDDLFPVEIDSEYTPWG